MALSWVGKSVLATPTLLYARCLRMIMGTRLTIGGRIGVRMGKCAWAQLRVVASVCKLLDDGKDEPAFPSSLPRNP